MKMKMILVSMLAVAVLAGCSDKNDERDKPINSGSADVAYISIKLMRGIVRLVLQEKTKGPMRVI